VFLLDEVGSGPRPRGLTHLVSGKGAQSLEDRGDVVFTGVRHVYSSASNSQRVKKHSANFRASLPYALLTSCAARALIGRKHTCAQLMQNSRNENK